MFGEQLTTTEVEQTPDQSHLGNKRAQRVDVEPLTYTSPQNLGSVGPSPRPQRQVKNPEDCEPMTPEKSPGWESLVSSPNS
jgi:hypothetical protein